MAVDRHGRGQKRFAEEAVNADAVGEEVVIAAGEEGKIVDVV